MNTNVHLGFQGNCREAFAFYEKVFGTKILMTMTYGQAPPGQNPGGEESKDMVMHTALPVGNITLMGADAPKGHGKPMQGFQICVDSKDEAEMRRVFAALSEGGSVYMPLGPTFWSPLFGMLTDQFGVGWMVSVTQAQA